jgi:hypothetical protein
MGIKGFPLIPYVGLDKIITHGPWIQKRNLAGEFLPYFGSPKRGADPSEKRRILDKKRRL